MYATVGQIPRTGLLESCFPYWSVPRNEGGQRVVPVTSAIDKCKLRIDPRARTTRSRSAMTARATVEVHSRSEAILDDLINLAEFCQACQEKIVVRPRDARQSLARPGISTSNPGVVRCPFLGCCVAAQG